MDPSLGRILQIERILKTLNVIKNYEIWCNLERLLLNTYKSMPRVIHRLRHNV